MSYQYFSEWTEETKDELVSNLKKLETRLNALDCEMILHGGTLLGAIRNRDLINHDNDIDIIILHKAKSKEEVKKSILNVDNTFHRNKALCGDFHYLGNNHYFINGQHFDGWHGWIEDRKLYVFYHIKGEIKECELFPLKVIKLRNELFKVPNKPQRFLELLYGKTWKKVSDNKPTIKGTQVWEFFNGQRYLYPEQKLTQEEILLDLKSLLEVNHVDFWLQTGTLLGAVRDENFIEWDEKDIDIGLNIDDYWKVKGLLDKSDFKYKWIWNKEIAIYKGEHVHPHIDLFFHTFDSKFAYCYSYKPNRISTIWNEEWRMKIPRNILEPLKTISFLKHIFHVPNKPKEYLKYLYGENWEIPDKNWKFQNFRSTDNEYKAITAIVPTFMRNDSITKLVKSFCALYPDIPLIIGNQNQEELEFDFPNVKVIELKEDCGLSLARNKLVSNVKTEFTLLLDDDFTCIKNTDIYKLLEVFSYHKDIGIVGGRLYDNNQVKSYEKFLFIMDKILVSIDAAKLIEQNIIEKHQINRITFGIADIIYNFFLAKTDVLKKYPWDNKHKIHSEHIDFFINLKKNSNVKVAYVPEVLIQHDHANNSLEYKALRKRMYYNYIYEKYGIEKGYTIGEASIVNYKENIIEKL